MRELETAAGVVLIAAPLWFNANFALLGKRFEYPDILRRSTSEVLERFRAGGSGLILLWWTFMLSGLLLIAGAVLLGQVLGFGGIVPLATAIGVLAGLVQMLGLLRWVHVVPALARAYADPTLEPEQREMHAAVFRALHQYLGVGVAEHLGYLFTGIWSVMIGVGVVQGTALPTWLVGQESSSAPDWWSVLQSSSGRTKSGDGDSQEQRSRSFTSRGHSGCSRWVSR